MDCQEVRLDKYYTSIGTLNAQKQHLLRWHIFYSGVTMAKNNQCSINR